MAPLHTDTASFKKKKKTAYQVSQQSVFCIYKLGVAFTSHTGFWFHGSVAQLNGVIEKTAVVCVLSQQ